MGLAVGRATHTQGMVMAAQRRGKGKKVWQSRRVAVLSLVLVAVAGCTKGFQVRLVNTCPVPVSVDWWSGYPNGSDPDARGHDAWVIRVEALSERRIATVAGFTIVIRNDEAGYRAVVTSDEDVKGAVETVTFPSSLCP